MRLNSKKNAPEKNPRRVLHVLYSVEGGVPVVVDQLVNGLDRNRYEPIVLFDTYHQSEIEIRKKLLLSDIKTIDFKKWVDSQTSSLTKPRKNLNISRRLEADFSKEASKIYLFVKNLSKFLRKQAPGLILLNSIHILQTTNNSLRKHFLLD